eukprot:12486106-Alexandrium_andersonii.AAC.1
MLHAMGGDGTSGRKLWCHQLDLPFAGLRIEPSTGMVTCVGHLAVLFARARAARPCRLMMEALTRKCQQAL